MIGLLGRVFSSLRGRVITVMVLGLGATAFAVVALMYLARTSLEQRTVRARDRVEAELERLTEIEPALLRSQRARHGRRGPSELRSGYVDELDMAENPRIAEVLRDAKVPGQPAIVQSLTPDGMPIVAGAVMLDHDAGFAWAVQRVLVGHEMSSLRIVMVCLAIAMLVMVFASVQTLVAFERGAGALRESVVLLGRDLRSPVKRPKLRELAEVAEGLDGLARKLSTAQDDKVRLLRELADHERWASLGRVVAGVAHEVRNPLAAIKLRTDLAEGIEGLPAPLREDLALIGSEVTRLDRLVRDLLLLADRKPSVESRVSTDLAALATKRVTLLQPWAEGHHVAIVVSGTGTAQIDVDAVTRVLDNLVRNAVEASPEQGVVRVDVEAAAPRKVQVTISDSGAGVTAENAQLVFEPFFTTKPSGTGLGLALSRAVAEAHGGTLEHARTDGMTRFTLVLATG